MLGEAPLSYSDVPKFEFATQVIQEALRLYPPFWMIDRMAVADDRVGDVAIPRGSMVIVYVYGAHHAPRYWQNPENFDPERFTKANEKLRTPFTYPSLRRRTARLYRRKLRDAADPHDFERSAQKIRFSVGSGPNDRSSPDGHPAAETRNPHDVHQYHRSRPVHRISYELPARQLGRERIFLPVQTVDATPSGHLIWQYVSSGPILWGCSSLLPKQDAFSLLLCSRMILSLWNSWTWDFLLVLRRPIETAPERGQRAQCTALQ